MFLDYPSKIGIFFNMKLFELRVRELKKRKEINDSDWLKK
jgi:hypothetical protein